PGNSSTWSVMRAPAESTSQKTGSSWRSAYSVIRTIFSTVRAPQEPAFTVGSLATTHTGRPSIRPTPVTTPSAGRSSARLLASRPSSTNEPASSSRASRSRTKSLFWAASFSPALARLPASARRVRRASSSLVWGLGVGWPAAGRSVPPSAVSSAPTSGAADGQDGHVVGDRLGREVPRRLQQVLAEHVRGLLRVAAQRVGDPLLAEHLVAVAHLGQAVGVHEQQVAGVEVDLAAVVRAAGVEHEQRSGGPQRSHLLVVPEPGGGVPRRREAQGAGLGVEHDDHQRDELLAAVGRRQDRKSTRL